jgi:integrase
MSGFVEKRTTGRWRARYRGPDGRERSKTFDRRVDADRWLAGVSFAIARGEWTDPARARVTVGDWSRQWLTAKAPSLKATTREAYRSILKTCIWPTWERVPLAAVTHSEVAAWVARLSAQVGASRCRKSAILLSGIMSAAVRDQRISRNPCDGVSLPRLPDHRQRFLTMAELQDLADRAGAYRLMIFVLGLCGLRFGECAALRVRSVDLMRRRLRVSESVSEVNGHMIWSTPKTHQSRDVPIPRSLIDALVAQAAGKKPEDVLFNSPNGEPIRLANWRQRVWDPAVAAAGLTGLTPHDLRHTAASLAIASGASVKHIQRMLGHKDAAMTLNVYASLFEDDLDDVSNRLDAALLEAAAACVRPEPSTEIIELPERTARTTP